MRPRALIGRRMCGAEVISQRQAGGRFTTMNTTANNPVWTDCETAIGRLTLTANERGIDGLFFPGRAAQRDEATRCPQRFDTAAAQLHAYLAGRSTQFDLELDLSAGTPFQRAVWAELQLIPYGMTVTYSQLAARLAGADRVRAVAAAIARTPVPIIVPCHRVIGSDGNLTGYLGGLHRKQALLDLEAAVRQGHEPPSSLDARQLALL